MSDLPTASVIVVNYNGAHFLEACLDALRRQSYPQDRFEVVVSDNGSSDNSINLLRHEYPWVKVIENNKNLGFAEGNNVAIRMTQSDYVVLLNNDTVPHEDWLKNLIRVASENPSAGVVTSHIHLFYDYLPISIRSDSYISPKTGRQLGVQIYGIESGVERGIYQYLDGFYGWEPDGKGRKYRWTNGDALVGLPVPSSSGDFTVKVILAATGFTSEPVSLKVSASNILLAEWHLEGDFTEERTFIITDAVRRKAVPVEQNTGSIIFRDASSRDRGTYVKNNEALFEFDHGQYAEVEQVFAGCGAGMLLRRKMLDDIGLLDGRFFMYYEDTDLCWRAHLRNWQVLYAPEAIVRHIHCGTMTEWSGLFTYLTDRNRLAMVLKNASIRQVSYVWGGYCRAFLKACRDSIKSGLLLKSDWRHSARRHWIYLNVFVRLMIWKPRLFWQRFKLQRIRLVSHTEIETWFQE